MIIDLWDGAHLVCRFQSSRPQHINLAKVIILSTPQCLCERLRWGTSHPSTSAPLHSHIIHHRPEDKLHSAGYGVVSRRFRAGTATAAMGFRSFTSAPACDATRASCMGRKRGGGGGEGHAVVRGGALCESADELRPSCARLPRAKAKCSVQKQERES